MKGFADCKEVAITVSGTIPDSEIYYGLFLPDKNKEWDKGWDHIKSVSGVPVITHFWVESWNQIYDYSRAQFGEEDGVSSTTDTRYVKVGKYNPVKDECTPVVQSPKILWPTLTKPGGTVQVIWPEYWDRYER